MHGIDIDDRHLVGEERLGRQDQRLGGEGRVFPGIGERLPHRRHEVGIERRRRRTTPQRLDPVEQGAGRDLLTRFPARERLGIVHRQKFQPLQRHALQLDRGRKAAQQRGHRRGRQIDKAKPLPLLGKREDPGPRPAFASPSIRVGNSAPSAASSPIASGISIGNFSGCPGVGGTFCATFSS